MTAGAQPIPVVVIGGGIAGLVAARDLAIAGHRPIVLEAADWFGGIVSAHRVGGLVLDAGAESFATARPAVGDLLTELGLGDRIVTPNPAGAWVRHRRGTAPLPAGALLGIPGRPWAADVRRVIGLAGALRCTVDAVLPTRSGMPAGTSLGHVVRSRMGRRVLERLVEPVAGGVYAADPGQLEIASVAPTLPDAFVKAGSLAGAARLLRGGGQQSGSAVATITGGLHGMVTPLADAVRHAGGVVRSGAEVRSLERDGALWRVTLADGSALSAVRVVLAVPAKQAAALLESALPRVRVGLLRAPITRVLLATVVLDDHRLDAAPRGTGMLVSARSDGVRAKALTHATAKWPWLAELAGPGRHVLRLSYGRGDGSDLPTGDVRSVALADAAELLGLPLSADQVVDSDVVHWPSALPAPRPGHAEGIRALRSDLRSHALTIVGAAVAGSGLAGVVGDARREAAKLSDSQTVAMIPSSTAANASDPAPG